MPMPSTTYISVITVLCGSILTALGAIQSDGSMVQMRFFQSTGDLAPFSTPMADFQAGSGCNDNSDCKNIPCPLGQTPACLPKPRSTQLACGCKCQAGDTSVNCDGVATLYGSSFGRFTFEGPGTSFKSKMLLLNGVSEQEGNGDEGPDAVVRAPEIKLAPAGGTFDVSVAHSVSMCSPLVADMSTWTVYNNDIKFTMPPAMTDIIVKSKSAEQLLEILDSETITKLFQLSQRK